MQATARMAFVVLLEPPTRRRPIRNVRRLAHMGTLYTVTPLDQKCAEWLDSEGVEHPPVSDSARYPTPREVADVLSRLSGYHVEIASDIRSGEWSAQIDSAGEMWAHLRIRQFSSEDTPHEFYFSKGWPEVIFTVTERLAQCCGTLVVVDDSSVRPVVISPGSDTKDLLRHYEVA